MKMIMGKKIGMTQIFNSDGTLIPVTVIKAGPCHVIQVKTREKDGYEALQVGFDEYRKEKNVTKPLMGHFKKANLSPFRFVREIEYSALNVSDSIEIDIFEEGQKISITGTSKGKGFQGVMKRLNYSGGAASHGSMFNRAPGSVGASSFPSRVWKNKGLPGQMGNKKITVKNIEIVKIKKEENLLIVKGAVPGANGGYLVIRGNE
jgi:large subunit ribosomal protein L3